MRNGLYKKAPNQVKFLDLMKLPFLLLKEFLAATWALLDRLLNYPYLLSKVSNDFVIDQQGFIKITKRVIVSYLIVFLVFSGTGLLFLFNPFGTDTADAAWFNDNWAYRKAISVTITSTATDRTNVDTLLTIDTNLGSTKLQSLCQDLRFTSTNGEIIPYYIPDTTSCNTNATNKIWVQIDLVPKSTTTYTLYMYYGNPSASTGSNATVMNAEASLVGYWKMNEASWTNDCTTGSVLDSSINSNNAQSCPNLTGITTPAAGNFGNAGDFNGTNQYLSTDITTNYSAFTASAWFYADTIAGGNDAMVSKNDYTGTNNGFYLRNASGTLQAGVQNASVDTQASLASGVTALTWAHAAITYDGATVSLYKNGTLVASNTGSIGTNTQDFKIGAGYQGDAEWFDGKVDDVRYYNRVLSATEITQLYGNTSTAYLDNTSTKFTASLGSEQAGPSSTLYWKFDEGQGTTAEDATTNALDGTLNNTPTYQTENMCISGKCLYFDGVSDENLSKTDDPKLDFVAADNFTVSAWVKRNGASSAINYILSKADATNGGYKLWMDDTGDFCFGVDGDTIWGASPDDTACTSGVDFDDDKWYFVSGVKAGTTSITLYVDGIQRAQDATIAATGTLANTNTFYVGVDRDAISNEWLGFIDEVKVTRDNTARSAAQVLADYNARSNPEGVASVLGTNTQNLPNALSNGLISYWKMDEAAANTCTGGVNDSCDSSGNAKNAPWTGNIAATTGKFGNAITLDGTGDYISMGADSTYNLAANYSFCSWFKTSIADKDIITNGTSSTGHYLLQVDGDGKLKAHSWTSSSNNAITSTTTVTGGSWTHGCQVVDNTNISVYVNGVRENTAVIVGTRGGQTGTFTIGARGGGVSHEWNGQLDEIRVYNRALSPPEVSSLYNWAPGPVGYWKLDEKNGQSIIDSSGNGYSGDIGVTSGSESTDPEWTQGKFGGGIQITASDTDRTTIAHNAALNPSAITIVSWVKRVNLASNGNIVSKRSNEGYRYRSSDNGLIEWFDRGGVNNISSGSNTIPSNQWAHVAVTGSASGLKIYINGVLANSNAVAYGAGATTGSLFFGGDPGGVGEHFNGGIDDVKVYSYERTASQIIEDMNAAHPAPGSPVGTSIGYWKFNEGAANTCSGGTNDACNSGNSGTTLDAAATGVAFTSATSGYTQSGKFGRAIGLDGTGDYLTNADSASSSITGDLSISTWVKLGAIGAEQTILGKWDETTALDDRSYRLYVTSANKFAFSVSSAGTSATTTTLTGSATTAATGTWYFVTAVYNKTNLTMDIYVNGRKDVAQQTGAPASIDNNISILYIGAKENTAGAVDTALNGTLDELKLYSGALTESQIKLDLNQGSAQVLGAAGDNTTAGEKQAGSQEYCIPGDSTTCTAPVGRWDFEGDAGQTTYDTSGNANNCTDFDSRPLSVGKIGKASSSTSGNMFCGSGSTIDNLPAAGMTIEGWIYPVTEGQFGQGMIAKKGGYNVNGWFFQFDGGLTNALKFAVDYDTTDLYRPTADNAVTLNAWNHVAATWTGSGTATTVKIYVNGREASYGTPTNGSTTRNSDAAEDWMFGNDGGGTAGFEGKIDQFRAFNYVRTPAQIAYDYNRGAPIAHWKMDECQGTTINNSAGNAAYAGTLTIGATGTYTTPGTCSTSSASSAWYNGASGRRNYSLAFDGTDDYINAGSSLDLANVSFSISSWAKRTSSGTFDIIVGKSASLTQNNSLEFGFRDSNVFTCAFYANDLNTTATYTDTNWHFYTCTFNASTNARKIYRDGIEVASDTAGADFTGSGAMYIGDHPLEAGEKFGGQIDETMIHGYDLTASQVKTLYNQGAANYGPTTGAP